MKKENKIVKFWPKLIARIIDLAIISVITTIVAYFMTHEINNKRQFIEPWMFYIFMIFMALLFLIIFLLIPCYWNGKSIGMYIARIKIVPLKYSLKKTIIIRETFFGLSWIFLIFIMVTFINHTLIIKLIDKQNDIVYKGWEAFRVAIFSTTSWVIVIIQLIFGISGLIRKNGISLHDNFASAKTVWINKFTEIPIIKKAKTIKPTKAKNNPVKWIDKGE
ncbi:RDD family protein [Candidatus Mycoplasma mahonii]|uniref:RDD family protein n=1 Tax=Candidatus Mycoplasma mahonii TaxID=3004105 RepID=UPI0026F2295F|nr:RDD family protein [Candidatus Mycoplasma mahonii]WKX02480.1 RDD family protein [Candidatus Mycoplasma mahonii]